MGPPAVGVVEGVVVEEEVVEPASPVVSGELGSEEPSTGADASLGVDPSALAVGTPAGVGSVEGAGELSGADARAARWIGAEVAASEPEAALARLSMASVRISPTRRIDVLIDNAGVRS
jgi:hypothetical protein